MKLKHIFLCLVLIVGVVEVTGQFIYLYDLKPQLPLAGWKNIWIYGLLSLYAIFELCRKED